MDAGAQLDTYWIGEPPEGWSGHYLSANAGTPSPIWNEHFNPSIDPGSYQQPVGNATGTAGIAAGTRSGVDKAYLPGTEPPGFNDGYFHLMGASPSAMSAMPPDRGMHLMPARPPRDVAGPTPEEELAAGFIAGAMVAAAYSRGYAAGGPLGAWYAVQSNDRGSYMYNQTVMGILNPGYSAHRRYHGVGMDRASSGGGGGGTDWYVTVGHGHADIRGGTVYGPGPLDANDVGDYGKHVLDASGMNGLGGQLAAALYEAAGVLPSSGLGSVARAVGNAAGNPWVQAAVVALLIVFPELDPVAIALRGLTGILEVGEDVNIALALERGALQTEEDVTEGLTWRPDASHIFRPARGHFANDLPISRRIIERTINDPTYTLGRRLPDGQAYSYYMRLWKGGQQTWAELVDDVITNGGINRPPQGWPPSRWPK